MNTKIWLSPPHLGSEELAFVKEAFSTNWISPMGPNIDQFEVQLESYFLNQKHVAALNSGSSAIHLAIKLLGISAGDEVLCQSNTFTASANAILYENGIPVFIDSEKESFNLCPELLKDAIIERIKLGSKPKAIITVHLYGMPYKVDDIHAIAENYDIPVIEDSAEAMGSEFNHNRCGSFGDFGILSFNGNKIITTSAGGALITPSKRLKNRAIHLATQANTATRGFNHDEIGYNYRMSNVLAGIGRGQLNVLDARIKRKREIYEIYKEQLADFDQLEFVPEPQNCFSNRWLSTVLTDSIETRDGILDTLEELNIEARPFWKPLHLQPVFKDFPNYTNGISADLFCKGLCLPSGTNMNEEDLKRVVNGIKNYFNK